MPLQVHDLHQANLLLPRVRQLASQISELTGQLPELQDELRISEYRARRAGAGEADAARHERAKATLALAEADLIAAIRALDELGVSLKDPGAGLVDFLCWRAGELVELCWRLGEDQISYWHPRGAGFAGRRPL